MPFWLHESRLTITCKSISLWHKVVITIGIFTLIVLSFLFFVYFPLHFQLHQIQQELIALESQKRVFESVICRFDEVIKEYNDVSADFKQLADSSFSMRRAVGNLLRLMQADGISCRGIKTQHRTNKGFFEKHYISFIGKGSFQKILRFLNDVVTSNCPIKFKSFHVYQSSGGALIFKAVIRIVDVDG
jgi:Tfp pilus assembly protein PilO